MKREIQVELALTTVIALNLRDAIVQALELLCRGHAARAKLALEKVLATTKDWPYQDKEEGK